MNETLRNSLNNLRQEFQITQKLPCSKEDEKKYSQLIAEGHALPDNIVVSKDYGMGNEVIYRFYVVKDSGLSSDEMSEYIMLKQLQNIRTIKNCVVFFTILSVISLLVSFISNF